MIRSRRLGMRAVVMVACGALLAGLSAGCATTAGGGPEITPAPVQHPMLQNFPVPMGFLVVSDQSMATTVGDARWARFEFEGPRAPEDVARFYLSYMPSANFELRQKRYERGTTIMRYESDREECTIRIERGRKKTLLFVDLAPRSGTTATAGSRDSATAP